MKINELGRSMIEMLGVLAVIGVLTTGGITGYSKAIEKYKFNKSIEQITTIISNATNLNITAGAKLKWSDICAGVLNDIDAIPQEMNTDNGLYLASGNDIDFMCGRCGSSTYINGMEISDENLNAMIIDIHNIVTPKQCMNFAMVNWTNLGITSYGITPYEDDWGSIFGWPEGSANTEGHYDEEYFDYFVNIHDKNYLPPMDVSKLQSICTKCSSDVPCSFNLWLKF